MTKSHPLGRLGAVIGALFIGSVRPIPGELAGRARCRASRRRHGDRRVEDEPAVHGERVSLTSAQQSEISKTLDDAKYPIYAVALPRAP